MKKIVLAVLACALSLAPLPSRAQQTLHANLVGNVTGNISGGTVGGVGSGLTGVPVTGISGAVAPNCAGSIAAFTCGGSWYAPTFQITPLSLAMLAPTTASARIGTDSSGNVVATTAPLPQVLGGTGLTTPVETCAAPIVCTGAFGATSFSLNAISFSNVAPVTANAWLGTNGSGVMTASTTAIPTSLGGTGANAYTSGSCVRTVSATVFGSALGDCVVSVTAGSSKVIIGGTVTAPTIDLAAQPVNTITSTDGSVTVTPSGGGASVNLAVAIGRAIVTTASTSGNSGSATLTLPNDNGTYFIEARWSAYGSSQTPDISALTDAYQSGFEHQPGAGYSSGLLNAWATWQTTGKGQTVTLTLSSVGTGSLSTGQWRILAVRTS